MAELRSLLREFGEKPDKLKKAEIITRIVELTEAKGSPLEKPAYWSQVDTLSRARGVCARLVLVLTLEKHCRWTPHCKVVPPRQGTSRPIRTQRAWAGSHWRPWTMTIL